MITASIRTVGNNSRRKYNVHASAKKATISCPPKDAINKTKKCLKLSVWPSELMSQLYSSRQITLCNSP